MKGLIAWLGWVLALVGIGGMVADTEQAKSDGTALAVYATFAEEKPAPTPAPDDRGAQKACKCGGDCVDCKCKNGECCAARPEPRPPVKAPPKPAPKWQWHYDGRYGYYYKHENGRTVTHPKRYRWDVLPGAWDCSSGTCRVRYGWVEVTQAPVANPVYAQPAERRGILRGGIF